MKVTHLLEFFGLAILWGASFLFMKMATPEFGPIPLIEMRVLIAAICLLPILFAKKLVRTTLKNAKPLILVGTLNSAIPFSLFAFATLYLTAGYTAVINATAPLWAAVIGFFWLKDRLDKSATIGLLIGFVGVIVLVWQKISDFDLGIMIGLSAAMVAAILYGYVVNYTKIKLKNVDALVTSTGSQVAASIVLAPFAIYFWPETPISTQSWAAVIVLGCLCTALAYILFFRLITNLGATKAITVTYFIPVFGSLFGYLVLNEAVSTDMYIGGTLIISGTALVMGLIKFPQTTSDSTTVNINSKAD